MIRWLKYAHPPLKLHFNSFELVGKLVNHRTDGTSSATKKPYRMNVYRKWQYYKLTMASQLNIAFKWNEYLTKSIQTSYLRFTISFLLVYIY